MQVRSIIDLEEVVAAGVRAGQLRSSLSTTTDELVEHITERVESRDAEARAATQGELTGLIPALKNLVTATDDLLNVHDLVSMVTSVRQLTEGVYPDVVSALAELFAYGKIGIPSDLIPEDARDGFEAASETELNPEFSARSLLSLAVAGIKPDTADQVLASWTFRRLWALHGVVLASIAARAPSASAASLDELSDLRTSMSACVNTLRDELFDIANQARSDDAMGPALSTRLWLKLDELETWILDEAADQVATAFAAASGRLEDGGDDAMRSARDAAIAYDAVRTLLALDAGGRAMLRAFATHDIQRVDAFTQASTLGKAPATLDLSRSTLAQAAAQPEGTVVEIAGVIQHAEYVVGGPSPRSVLTLGSPAGTQIRVFVPFMAVDSFGVTKGVWIQTRGEMFPDGKDDLSGPVLQVRRIRRQVAAETSFLDYLTWIGRNEFEYRPGGVDLIAGRIAGDDVTAAELGLRL